MTSPADEIHAAAEKLRGLIDAMPTEHWDDRPWHAEECNDTEGSTPCPCIVAQGEYREFDQPQAPPIQYVADAETPEFAAYITTMDPTVGSALVAWLDFEADLIKRVPGAELRGRSEHALAVARAINGRRP